MIILKKIIIKDLKKGMAGYHDEKLFRMIKNKKKQLGRLKKSEHELTLQKYKWEGTIREGHGFQHQEMPGEYNKIIAGIKNNTKEYIELCNKILGEYDLLNRRKEHKDKELLSSKLNHLSKHEKVSNDKTKINGK